MPTSISLKANANFMCAVYHIVDVFNGPQCTDSAAEKSAIRRGRTVTVVHHLFVVHEKFHGMIGEEIRVSIFGHALCSLQHCSTIKQQYRNEWNGEGWHLQKKIGFNPLHGHGNHWVEGGGLFIKSDKTKKSQSRSAFRLQTVHWLGTGTGLK